MGFTDTISSAIQKETLVIESTDSLRTAIQKMTQANATGLIVKSGGDLIGIVTVMDLMNSVANDDDLDTTPVSSFMTACELITDKVVKTPCVQLDEGQNVKDALKIMNEAGVRNLLVSGDNNEAIGMVSALSLLKLAIS